MPYLKKGFPEEGEIVICTVTKVHHHSVFAKLDEYGIDGLIHISEVSPGRIRNIRDFVKEGKKVVCKILRINKEKGHVDLSLRRVNDSQRRKKVDEIKQEQKAEKIVEHVAKLLKIDSKKLYTQLAEQVLNDYDSMYSFFMDIIVDEADFSEYKIDKKTASELIKIIKQRLKPIKVSIKGRLMLTSHAPDGVKVIKDAIKKGLIDGVEMKYLGAGKYDIVVTAPDYKQAEEIMENSTKAVLDQINKSDGEGEFFREK